MNFYTGIFQVILYILIFSEHIMSANWHSGGFGHIFLILELMVST